MNLGWQYPPVSDEQARRRDTIIGWLNVLVILVGGALVYMVVQKLPTPLWGG